FPSRSLMAESCSLLWITSDRGFPDVPPTREIDAAYGSDVRGGQEIMSAAQRPANSAPSQQPLGLAQAPVEGDGVETSPDVADRVAKTTCYMCACRCGINVHVKDGKVRYINGNKDHPVNRGVICGKGSAGIMQHYSPARLKKPLLRSGPRGSGEFREIEWDEALEIATARLSNIRRTDPKKLAFF